MSECCEEAGAAWAETHAKMAAELARKDAEILRLREALRNVGLEIATSADDAEDVIDRIAARVRAALSEPEKP